jgi:hypothetical protein
MSQYGKTGSVDPGAVGGFGGTAFDPTKLPYTAPRY